MTATQTQAKYRVLGTNNDASECCCCGRQGLKSVVWLQPIDADGNEYGAPVHFGRVCGARAAGWGYGTDLSRIEARIRREEKETLKRYWAEVSSRIKSLEQSGAVVVSRVAYGFDAKSGTWNYGMIYTLPNDPILTLTPFNQRETVAACKVRLRAAYPIFLALDGHQTAATLRALLA